MSTPAGPHGLRERKKARTRTALQETAVRLFREQGYAATTVRQIAAAADVSEQTFFRYFPTKVDTLFDDRIDTDMVEAFVAQPADLDATSAFRATLRAVYGNLTPEQRELEVVRRALVVETGDLAGAVTARFQGGMARYAEALARRTGRSTDDPAVRTWVGAMSGVAIAAYLTWAADPTGASATELLDESMALLADGIGI